MSANRASPESTIVTELAAAGSVETQARKAAMARRPFAPRRSPVILMAMGFYEVALQEGIVQWVREHEWELDSSIYPVVTMPPNVACDGILTTIANETTLGLLSGFTGPMVRMLTGASPEAERMCSHIPLVCCDYESTGRMGAQHLLSLGRPHFAFYNRGIGVDLEGIRRGFVGTIRDAGHEPILLDFPADHPHLDPTRRQPRELRLTWLSEKIRALPLPLAIMAEDDRFAVDVAVVAQALGLRIPNDIAILGADDNRLALGVSPVGISSVDSNLRGVGHAAAQLLADLIHGKAAPAEPIRIQSRRVITRRSTATYAGGHQGVSEALRFVRQRFSEPLSGKRVARQAGMSLRGLQNALHEEAGLTLNGEITRLRLTAATQLLEETDLKLESIAADVGLRDAKNLCRVFRQHYGTTPQQWRMRMRRS